MEHLRPHKRAVAIAVLGLPAMLTLSVSGQNRHTIEEQILYPTTTIRVQAMAESTLVIRNPANNTQIEYVIAEGSRVEQGDLLARFDMTFSLDELRKARNEEESKRLAYSNEVAGIEENLLSLENSLAEVKDELKVLHAQLDYQQALPLEDELAISKGRLDVARKNAEAEQKELDRAQDRFERKMISPRALKKAERVAANTDALYRHAEMEYRLAGLSASSNTIRILELKIENAELLEIRLTEELTKRAEIAAIQQRASEAETALRQDRVAKLVEDTSKTNLYAPRAGTILYTGRFKRRLLEGEKPSKNEGLLEIPDLESLVLQGAIRDEQRGFFNVGDEATVYLNPDRDTALTGRVKSISPLPRDLTEGSSKQWGKDDQTSGIKIYDLSIAFDTASRAEVPLGIFGTAQIRAKEPLVAPAVPLSFVRSTQEGFFLSVKGRFQPVEGRVMKGMLILDDKAWRGKTVSSTGEFAPAETKDLPIRTDRLVSSGELTPLNSVLVKTPRTRTYGIKIKSLIAENSHVEVGDELADLESEHQEKRIQQLEAELSSARSQRQSNEEKAAIESQRRELGLRREQNLLDIRKHERAIVEEGSNYTALNNAELALEQAEIELTYLQDELAWAEERPDNFAPAELERMRRDVRRQVLKHETASIKRAIQQRGATPLQRARAIHDEAVQQAKVDEMIQDLGMTTFDATRKLKRSQKQEQQLENRLKQAYEDSDSLVVRATESGLVKYERVWDGLGISKVKVGLSIWPGAQLMSISNTDQMFVRIPVPEYYFSKVKGGMPVDVLIPSVSQEKFAGTISRIEFMLSPREQGNTDIGLYGSHEPTGSQVFYARVTLDKALSTDLKAGATAHVIFPFPR